ncbi:MAG: hypothetical protein KME29_01695 [Calothrix sp. FI2-JRJ7]|jgi:hypothetical protein|nr:hypothetical protein [Calothrix sp. FI2-JRJ7]
MPPKPQLEFNWCAPVSGDGFYLGLPTWERPPEFEYIEPIPLKPKYGNLLLYKKGVSVYGWTF